MFSDDTNLFFKYNGIKDPFTVVNRELVNIKDWFTTNKLSLSVENKIFFYKPSKNDDIPLRLPKLIVNNYEIKREGSIKFCGVLLDQHITWKEHIKLTENNLPRT